MPHCYHSDCSSYTLWEFESQAALLLVGCKTASAILLCGMKMMNV